MSNVLSFPEKPGNSGFTSVEATPDGIRLDNRLVGYATAIRQLDAGRFDASLSDGLRVAAEIQIGETRGWFRPTDEQTALFWRWIVACLFICEQQRANGTVDVANEDGGTDRAVIYAGQQGNICVYPAPERFSLASHIEALAIEKYGVETGLPLAVKMYQGMTEVDPHGGALRLSQMGREGLTMLHDGFIEMLRTEGMPAAPTAH